MAVNPNDTEESIWAFLCEAQLVGAEAARQQFLQVRYHPWNTDLHYPMSDKSVAWQQRMSAAHPEPACCCNASSAALHPVPRLASHVGAGWEGPTTRDACRL